MKATSGSLDFLIGGGEMAQRIAAFDWTATALGPIELWPQSLRTAVSLVVNSKYPHFLAWGPDLVFLYNDAYAPLLGSKTALGLSFPRIWAEAWDKIGPIAQRALDGEASFFEDEPVPVAIHGQLETRYYTFSYSPVRSEQGVVGGMLGTVAETTDKVKSVRAARQNEQALTELNLVAGSVLAELRIEPLMQVVTDAAVRVSGAQFGAFFHHAVADNGDLLPLYAISGAPREAFSKFPLPRMTGIFGPTFEQSQIKRSDDITADPAYGHNAPHKGMPPGHLPVRSYLAVPVLSRDGEVYGAIFLGHGVPARFTEKHEQLVAGIASQAAIGIVNARLYREQQRLLGAERAARADAERESRLKEQFLNTLSHELRSPLNAIVGWAGVLRMKYPDHPDLARGLEVIERNGDLQAQIINDLLDMSRITSGRVHLDPSVIDVTHAVDDAIEAVRPQADAKQLRIESVVDGTIRPVRGDPVRLQQVFWNLLNNAVKFTPSGGIVTVRCAQDPQYTTVTFTDSGRGIESDVLPYIFDRFRQGDGSVGREYGGLGLGLAIVKSLVDMHHGSVEAQSAGRDQGATFTVRLPSVQSTDAIPERSLGKAIAGTGKTNGGADISGIRILVVDDDQDAAQMMQLLLAAEGAQVDVAIGAVEAIRHIQAARPDVMLSDIGMPGRDGYQLIRDVREHEQRHNLPALPAAAVTAFARAEDVQRAHDCGFDAHLPKPVGMVEVVAMVERLVRHSTRVV